MKQTEEASNVEKTTNTAKEVRRSHRARTKGNVFAELEAPSLAMSSWVSPRSNRPMLSCRYVKHVILLASCSSRCILSEEREREREGEGEGEGGRERE